MPDRPSSQGLPDDWSRGSHAARGQHPGTAASDVYAPGVAGAYRARTGSADPFGPANAGLFGTRNADPYGAGTAGGYGAGTAGGYGAGTAGGYGAGMTNGGAARTDTAPPAAAVLDSGPGEATVSKGFLSALFDFGFTSFVTPKVIKLLYVLIMIGTVASALVFTFMAFKVSTVFGLLTLIIGDPLFILIVMAIYRIILEFFVVVFRVAEDVRALRERGGLG
jgi:Domain of unknown function (DUF4282)